MSKALSHASVFTGKFSWSVFPSFILSFQFYFFWNYLCEDSVLFLFNYCVFLVFAAWSSYLQGVPVRVGPVSVLHNISFGARIQGYVVALASFFLSS